MEKLRTCAGVCMSLAFQNKPWLQMCVPLGWDHDFMNNRSRFSLGASAKGEHLYGIKAMASVQYIGRRIQWNGGGYGIVKRVF